MTCQFKKHFFLLKYRYEDDAMEKRSEGSDSEEEQDQGGIIFVNSGERTNVLDLLYQASYHVNSIQKNENLLQTFFVCTFFL